MDFSMAYVKWKREYKLQKEIFLKDGEQMWMTDIMLDLLKETGYYLGANETNL